MKIGKFVGKETLVLDNNDIAMCIDRFQGTKLSHTSDSDIIGRIYNQRLENKKIQGKHNYWGTQNQNRNFKAVAKNIMVCVTKRCGKIESNEMLTYIEGSEGTIQYSVSIKLYGDLHYKYQRGYFNDVEIYSFYDYDTDLGELLNRAKEYYKTLEF